ncbi:TRAP transporter small permease [Chloroflexota bacterium]
MRFLAKALAKFLDILEEFNLSISSSFLFIILGFMVYEIITRYIIKSTLVFSEQIMMTMLGWSVFLLIGEIARKDDHIRIGFFIDRLLGKKAPLFVYALESIASFSLCIYLIHCSIRWIKLQKFMGIDIYITPSGATYKEWMPNIVIPIALIMASLFYLERIILQARHLFRQYKMKGEISIDDVSPEE